MWILVFSFFIVLLLANFKSNETICSRRPLDVRYDIAIFQYAGKERRVRGRGRFCRFFCVLLIFFFIWIPVSLFFICIFMSMFCHTCSFCSIVFWFSFWFSCCQTYSFFHFFVSCSLCHRPSVALCCLMFASCLWLQLHSNCFIFNMYRIIFPRHFGWGAQQALLMNKIHGCEAKRKSQWKSTLAMNIYLCFMNIM